MKISNKTIYLVLGLLFTAVATLVILNRGDPALRRALEENRQFQILSGGEVLATVGMQDLVDLNPVEFTVIMDTSISDPREVTLLGVELRSILQAFKINAEGVELFVCAGLDGYYSPITRDEVEKEENVYICLAMDGKYLESQAQGGLGPFLMVIRDERFSQRWCKYLQSVSIS